RHHILFLRPRPSGAAPVRPRSKFVARLMPHAHGDPSRRSKLISVTCGGCLPPHRTQPERTQPVRLAIIPARGGSKRIPRKNIRHVGGLPAVAWPIRAALASDRFDMVVVSTDDEEIAE